MGLVTDENELAQYHAMFSPEAAANPGLYNATEFNPATSFNSVSPISQYLTNTFAPGTPAPTFGQGLRDIPAGIMQGGEGLLNMIARNPQSVPFVSQVYNMFSPQQQQAYQGAVNKMPYVNFSNMMGIPNTPMNQNFQNYLPLAAGGVRAAPDLYNLATRGIGAFGRGLGGLTGLGKGAKISALMDANNGLMAQNELQAQNALADVGHHFDQHLDEARYNYGRLNQAAGFPINTGSDTQNALFNLPGFSRLDDPEYVENFERYTSPGLLDKLRDKLPLENMQFGVDEDGHALQPIIDYKNFMQNPNIGTALRVNKTFNLLKNNYDVKQIPGLSTMFDNGSANIKKFMIEPGIKQFDAINGTNLSGNLNRADKAYQVYSGKNALSTKLQTGINGNLSDPSNNAQSIVDLFKNDIDQQRIEPGTLPDQVGRNLFQSIKANQGKIAENNAAMQKLNQPSKIGTAAKYIGGGTLGALGLNELRRMF